MENFVIKDIPGRGKGLFAKRPFDKGSILFKFNGNQISSKEIITNNIPSNVSQHYLQINTDLYLDIGQDASLFVNHNCNPNCYVKIRINTAFLLAYIPIKEGQELVFDYSTTSTDKMEDWSITCKCAKFGCRRVISGFQYLPEDKKERYIKAGIVPNYVRR